MLSSSYLLDHIRALIRLSHEVQDRTTCAKLREMADELRIIVSVADVTDLAATLNRNVQRPAPGSDDTQLSESSLLLELHRA